MTGIANFYNKKLHIDSFSARFRVVDTADKVCPAANEQHPQPHDTAMFAHDVTVGGTLLTHMIATGV